jgi:hypothetical protein
MAGLPVMKIINGPVERIAFIARSQWPADQAT